MKKCPKCELNYIADNIDLCESCNPQPKSKEQIILLSRGRVCGTRAFDIYELLSTTFNWDKTKRFCFGSMQLLYGPKTDSERKRSIWFIAHSNWTKTKNEKWINTFFIDRRKNANDILIEKDMSITNYIPSNKDVNLWIREHYINGSEPSTFDKTDRIVFAKNQASQYVFLGVYKIYRQTAEERIYQCISLEYPLKNNY